MSTMSDYYVALEQRFRHLSPDRRRVGCTSESEFLTLFVDGLDPRLPAASEQHQDCGVPYHVRHRFLQVIFEVERDTS